MVGRNYVDEPYLDRVAVIRENWRYNNTFYDTVRYVYGV